MPWRYHPCTATQPPPIGRRISKGISMPYAKTHHTAPNDASQTSKQYTSYSNRHEQWELLHSHGPISGPMRQGQGVEQCALGMATTARAAQEVR